MKEKLIDLFTKIVANKRAMSLIRIVSIVTLLRMYKLSSHSIVEQIVYVLAILILMLACSDYE